MSISFLATKGVFLSVFVYGNSQKGEIGDNNSVFTKSIVKVRSPEAKSILEVERGARVVYSGH